MRTAAFLLSLLLLAAPGWASHDQGKGARSLGGATVPRTATLQTLEADQFAQHDVGAIEADPSATGGVAWNLTTYGAIKTTISVDAPGVAWFDIRARGWHPEGMMNPHMHIKIDGVQRGEWDVRGVWLTYPQSVPILAGTHTIEVDNYNNYYSSVADRPLIVDWLSFTTPTLEGSPHVPAGGYVVVDAADIHNSVTGELQMSTLARNGTQWLQWGQGCFAEMIVFEGSGAHAIEARLKGDVVNGVGTRVQVKVDARQVDQYFLTTDWQEYDSDFSVAAPGPHMVELCYDNDVPGEKRTMTLDELSVESRGAPVIGPGWTSAHAGLDNTRHVASGISAATIGSARVAWSIKAAGPVTGTPAESNGIVYFGDGGGKIHAVKETDGSQVWSADEGAPIDSSLALDAARVYAGDAKGWISAHSRSDGSLVWRVRADPVNGTHLYGSPVLLNGVLYTGVASEQTLIEYNGPEDFQGSVAAFDASDGALLWRAPLAGDGHGVSVWSTPAIDPKLGLLFVGSGQSYNTPVSPYSDSILALDLKTGAIRWSYQNTPGDGFDARGGSGPDRDFGASPILFESNGRALVADGDKGGTFVALDRATGAVVWTAHANFTLAGVPPSQVEGFLGTASYDDGMFFAPTTARSMVTSIDAATGAIRWDTELNPLPRKYGDRMFGPSTAAEDIILQGNAFGRVFALDTRTGEILANLSAGGGVQGGISIDGDRFFVPNVGQDLWSGGGGLTAFVVTHQPTVSSPSPSTSPLPQRTTPAPTQQENTVVGNGTGAIARGLPGPGLIGIACVALIAAAIRRRSRP